ncbi:MAG: beta-ketoacyl-ACP synthase [Pseudomonadota bacterium]
MTKHLDHRGRPIIAITGFGVVSSLGEGWQDNWRKLTSGVSGIHRITRFPTEHLRTTMAGTVDFLAGANGSSYERTFGFAKSAASEALVMAGTPEGSFGGALVVAAPPVEIEWAERFELDKLGRASDSDSAGYRAMVSAAHGNAPLAAKRAARFGEVAANLQAEFGSRGLPITLSTACASGATAIQTAAEMLHRGETDRALAIGTDGSVTAEALIRFSLLSALSTQNDDPKTASKPFSKDRDGFVMAEGAGAFVLETLEAAKARGAKVLGILAGCGECADDFHRTRSKPDGSPAIAAVRRALDDAGITPGEVDYINAHGTSTPENDKMEYMSLTSVFGERLGGTPISSNKSMIGHTLTAAGAIEAVFSLLAIRESTLPPTVNHQNPDPAIDLDVVPNEKRDATVSRVLSNSFGFGGQNACLVIAAEPE